MARTFPALSASTQPHAGSPVLFFRALSLRTMSHHLGQSLRGARTHPPHHRRVARRRPAGLDALLHYRIESLFRNQRDLRGYLQRPLAPGVHWLVFEQWWKRRLLFPLSAATAGAR